MILLSYSAFHEQFSVCLLYLPASSTSKRANASKANNKFRMLGQLCAVIQDLDPRGFALVDLNFKTELLSLLFSEAANSSPASLLNSYSA